jgi:hypothetical protein
MISGILAPLFTLLFYINIGNGSNVPSAHESNNELSGDPSAMNQELSGQSTSEFDEDPRTMSDEPQVLLTAASTMTLKT